MSKRALSIRDTSVEVRDCLYGDGVVCKSVKECTFNNYILDNPANAVEIDRLLQGSGINLLVAPPGGGKSHSLIERANALVAKDKDCKVVIACPLRGLVKQLGKKNGVDALCGGETMNPNSRIIAVSFEKFFEVLDYIECKPTNEKIVLVVDECHIMTTQNSFRKEAINRIIRGIEQQLFYNVLLITASPEPMSLFHFNEIVEFIPNHRTSAIDKIEILIVDDVVEYLKKLDCKKEFPFVRLCDMKLIDEVQNAVPYKFARITSEDKETNEYLDIVEKGRIDANTMDGILTTSVLEAGVSVTDYPDNIVPICAFANNHISVDDVEQFLNRIRRVASRKINCARVVLRKPNPKDIKVSLVNIENKVLCEFQDVVLEEDKLTINDSCLLDGIADGMYQLKIKSGKNFHQDCFHIVSSDYQTMGNIYCKTDNKPIVLHGVGFKPFLDIFKSNLARCKGTQDKHIELSRDMGAICESKIQARGLSDWEASKLRYEYRKMVVDLTKICISEIGELAEALSWDGDGVKIDKRLVYMHSYFQFNRQYYRNPTKLKAELEERMGIPIVVREEENAKSSHITYNQDDIWDGIDDLRTELKGWCTDDFCETILGNGAAHMLISPKIRELAKKIREQKHLMEFITGMKKKGVPGGIALQILVNSKTQKKINQYIKMYSVIAKNRYLKMQTVLVAKDVFLYNKVLNDKLQVAIYCYLEKSGVRYPTVNKKLLENIKQYYIEQFTDARDIPTPRKIKPMLYMMYRTYGKDRIDVKGLYVDGSDIFTLVEAENS